MWRTTAITTVAALALSGCATAPAATSGSKAPGAPSAAASSAAVRTDDVLASLGLAGLTGKQVVEKLDQDPSARPLAMKASVRPDQVIVGNGTSEVSLPLSGERSFYLSIAPYVSRTHDCFFHSLATCKGELSEQPVHVRIADSSGVTLVDKRTSTYANGFVGFWLPKDITGTVTVTAAGKTGSVPFATGPKDATCLTTLQVS